MINNFQRSLRALTMLAAALAVFAALPGRTANAVDTKPLYERLGGYDGISAVLAGFGFELNGRLVRGVSKRATGYSIR